MHRELSSVVLGFSALVLHVRADDAPRDIVKDAIQVHGGKERLARTLTGTLRANGKLTLAPDFESAVSWEETFELPRRYWRKIRGDFKGEPFTMEYAVTEGKGWIRQNGSEVKDYNGKALTLEECWNATLALLPGLMDDGIKLEPGGTE